MLLDLPTLMLIGSYSLVMVFISNMQDETEAVKRESLKVGLLNQQIKKYGDSGVKMMLQWLNIAGWVIYVGISILCKVL